MAIDQSPTSTPPLDLTAYQADQAVVAAVFQGLPRGSQATASYDLRVSQSSISGVLSLRMIDRALLERLRRWAEQSFSQTIKLPSES